MVTAERRELGVKLSLALIVFGALLVTRAATVFPGEFGESANWTAEPDLGSASMDTTSVVITGPGGAPGADTRSSVDVMRYVGPSSTGVTADQLVRFHWRLAAGNSLSANALFGIAGGDVQTLGSLNYGGGSVEGDYEVSLARGDTFAFALDSQIYKGTAPVLSITDLTVLSGVPEASTWGVCVVLVLGVAWRWRWALPQGLAS